jgi:hypothetical protein
MSLNPKRKLAGLVKCAKTFELTLMNNIPQLAKRDKVFENDVPKFYILSKNSNRARIHSTSE